MKIFPLLLSMIFACCSSLQGQNRPEAITVKSFSLKSSIRAIEVVNDSTLWFAGSNGKYGRIINDQIEIDSISHEGQLPHFRSIAYNGKHIFLLSIESPALLYKIDPDRKGSVQLVYKETGPKVFYDSMTFLDEQNGIAIGDPVENCLSILTSKDAGDHWTRITCDMLPEIDEGEAAFAASNTNIAAYEGQVWVATGGARARVIKGDQKFENWKASETPISQGGKMTGIFSIDFYDHNTGIIMGGNWEEKQNDSKSKAITLDGGESWSLAGDKSPPGYISCVQFVPGKSGKQLLAVSTEGLYFSDDKAGSWIKILDKGYYSLRFADEKTVWLSANDRIEKIKLM